MKRARTSFFATAALLALSVLSVPAFAQQNDQERDRMKSTEISITGCLTKAENGEGWQLQDNDSGAKTTVLGAADFEKHTNHTVKATGTPSEDGKTFNVTKIEMVADNCPAK
jgi:ABC-type glycerol-3-phosphate transport system substrate-binding protein